MEGQSIRSDSISKKSQDNSYSLQQGTPIEDYTETKRRKTKGEAGKFSTETMDHPLILIQSQSQSSIQEEEVQKSLNYSQQSIGPIPSMCMSCNKDDLPPKNMILLAGKIYLCKACLPYIDESNDLVINPNLDLGILTEAELYTWLCEYNDQYQDSIHKYDTAEEICPVCYNELNHTLILQLANCGHRFCKTCLQSSLQYYMDNNKANSVKCLQGECGAPINDDDLQEILDSKTFLHYQYLKRNIQLQTNINLRFCPAPDCIGYDIGSKKKTTLACNVCGFEFCYYCNDKVHPNGRCQNDIDKLLDVWSSKKNVRYCPGCQKRVEKVDGCSHMSCPYCNTQWCWNCGQSYNESNHFWNCQGTRELFINPPIWFIAFLLFSPLYIPLYGVCFGILLAQAYIQEHRFPNRRFYQNPIFLYVVGVIIGGLSTPFLPFVFAGVMTHEWRGWRFPRSVAQRLLYIWRLLACLILGLILFCLLLIAAAVVSVFAHVFSYFLIIYKVGILVFCYKKFSRRTTFKRPW